MAAKQSQSRANEPGKNMLWGGRFTGGFSAGCRTEAMPNAFTLQVV